MASFMSLFFLCLGMIHDSAEKATLDFVFAAFLAMFVALPTFGLTNDQSSSFFPCILHPSSKIPRLLCGPEFLWSFLVYVCLGVGAPGRWYGFSFLFEFRLRFLFEEDASSGAVRDTAFPHVFAWLVVQGKECQFHIWSRLIFG